MENQPVDFSTHATELRARVCRVMIQLGLLLQCVEKTEESIASPGDGQPFADLVLVASYLDELAMAAESAGEHMTTVSDKIDVLTRVVSRALRAVEHGPETVPAGEPDAP